MLLMLFALDICTDATTSQVSHNCHIAPEPSDIRRAAGCTFFCTDGDAFRTETHHDTWPSTSYKVGYGTPSIIRCNLGPQKIIRISKNITSPSIV